MSLRKNTPVCFGNPKKLRNILGYTPSEDLGKIIKQVLNEALK